MASPCLSLNETLLPHIRFNQDMPTSPAPSCISMKSDQSMGRPITFSTERNIAWIKPEKTLSPCLSRKSDEFSGASIICRDETCSPDIKFNQDMPTSPVPSYISMKSDQSMGRPITFSTERNIACLKQERPSPAPTCISANSDQSMDQPVTVNKARDLTGFNQDMPTSPAPSYISMKSDQSMGRPITFSTERNIAWIKPEKTLSPYLSRKSDKFSGASVIFRNETCSPDTDINELSASLLTDEHFRCSVCTDVLKEPVTIPCGHNYCRSCIQTYWSKPTYAGSFSCPQCMRRFQTRPTLKPNTALAVVVEKLQQAGFSPARPAHCYAGPGEVGCDFCTGRKLRAVKSCLTCSASYCEIHVKQHYTVAALQRHTLVEATGDLEQRLCKLHLRALEVFCKTDQTFICFICMMEEHKEHDTVMSKSESPTAEANTSVEHMYKRQKMDEEFPLKYKNLHQEMELHCLTKCFFRGLEEANDWTLCCIEVAALGRSLGLGMLYDCRNDSFSSDVFLWNKETLSPMSLSFPRPHTDVRILEEDSLQERLRALDLTPGLRASVGAGLVELAGSAAFLNHPTQSLLQDRVTLHYRTSTRLDMLSHTLLNSVPPLSLTNQNKATHVVVAVLYGTQAFFVFDNDTESSEGSIILKDVVKRNFISHSAAELLSDLDENQKANCLSDCTVYTDAADFKSTKNFNTMRQMFFQNFLEPHSQSLKVWLYPLKNLDQTAPCVSGELSEDLLLKAEIVLESLKCKCDSCQEIKSLYHYLDVISCFPAMMESFSEISALLVKYRSEFQSALASCIKNIRERGVEEEECGLRDLLNRHDQSPFSPENIQQWFHNRDAEVMALILCRDNNVTIVQSEEELIDILQDSQDTVWCFTLTSLEREDPFLSALKQHIPLHTLKIQDTQFRLPDTSERILSDLQAFLAKKELEKNEQQIKFITAYISGPHSPSPSIRLYQSGSLVSYNVKLDVEPNLPEIITVKQTSVILNLQRGVKRVEYRAISSRRMNSLDMKWRAEVLCSTGEKCEVLDLTPDTQYELRYAVMDSNSMSNYSRITEFWTLPRSTPGQPRVLKHTQNVLTVAWETVAGDSPVLHYMVEYMEAGLEGWQSILTEGPVCKCTIKLPYSTCYRVRVSAVYGEEDTSRPSTEAEVPVDKWYVNLSKRKASLFIEVLKLQTEKKPVKLRDWSNEESEVSSFLQCLPYISQLSFGDEVFYQNGQKRRSVMEFLLKLTVAAAEWDVDTGESFTKLMMSVCSSPYFPLDEYYGGYRNFYQCDFLLDLYSHVKDYETQTGRSVLPALQPVYQSAPAVWNIDLSERKTSLFLEVLKLQTEKKPVKLRGWSDEESEVRSFLQCLPYISQLSCKYGVIFHDDEKRRSLMEFLLKLTVAAAEWDVDTGESFTKLMMSVCSSPYFPLDEDYEDDENFEQCDFLLDLYSHVKDYETQTDRSVLPVLQPVYQSAPAVWYIDLSKRKTSLFLEVLKLQTEKKPVELRGWSDEESEVRSFLQCLPYMSKLSCKYGVIYHDDEKRRSLMEFLLKLTVTAAEWDVDTGESFTKLLMSVCSSPYFPLDEDYEDDEFDQCDFLLDLCSHVKDYETQTGRSVLPALQPVYQSAPAVWNIDLSQRKTSLFLEVLKLQTEKKPVELKGWSDEESEVRSFLQCLPYISKLSCKYGVIYHDDEKRRSLMEFLLKLTVTAAEWDVDTGESFTKLMMSVCSSPYFPLDEDYEDDEFDQCDFLLDLCSHVKDYETQTGRSVLPALQPVYQSAPAVWNIDLSQRKTSLFLEVLKLQTEKKPVELKGWSDEESEVRSFLQCLPYISKLSCKYGVIYHDDEKRRSLMEFLLKLTVTAAEWDVDTGESFTKLMMSVCSSPYFPLDEDYWDDEFDQCDFLLDLCSHVKDYETQTGRSVLPVLQPVYQSAPAVWNIDLSERKTSLFLEVLKLQTVKKPVELRNWSDEESEVRSFLQCLPYISDLRGAEQYLPSLCKELHSREQVAALLQTLDSTLSLGGELSTSSCRAVGRVLALSASTPNLTLTPRAISLRGARLLFTHVTHLHTLRLSSRVVGRMVRALRVVRAPAPLTIQELSLILTDTQQTEGALSRVLSSLASLLRLWNVQCLNLTEYKMEAQSLTVLLSHRGPLTIRVCKETLQQLVVVVYEGQEEELTHCFLQKVGGDLTSCTLNWEEIHYFLQYQPVTVDFRKSNFKQQNPRELLAVLDRLQFRGVDRLLLLRLLHCCSVYELQQGAAAAVLLSTLQHRLDFSCSSALDLTEDTQTHTLTLSTEDCRVVSMAIQRAHTHTHLTLHDCEIEEAGVEQLFPILHRVTLHCSKSMLLQFLSLVRVGTELECVRRSVALSRALGGEVDLSHTRLDQQACRSLVLVLEHSEGLSELDLSHCQLTDDCLQLLFPHLHKTNVLDLSHNDITDRGVAGVYSAVSSNSNMQAIRLFNNPITDRQLFVSDRRFEIW